MFRAPALRLVAPRFLSSKTPSMASAPPAHPLIAIVGATGTGKSQLAVELALRFNGEIVNADALQIYPGLDIITNKMPAAERQGVPHHLIGVASLEEKPWAIGRFKAEAEAATMEGEGEAVELENDERFPVLKGPTEGMIEMLKEVDPLMANRWHPNDRRKIRRSLEIWLTRGERASEIYQDQQRRNGSTDEQAGTATLSGDPLILWLHADREILKIRLDRRVLQMVEDGLVAELQQLYNSIPWDSPDLDKTRGKWVAIGLRQFDEYLKAVEAGTASPSQLDALLQDGIAKTQRATKHYAGSQVRWIRIKMINALTPAQAATRMFLLDGSIAEKWLDTVQTPALAIAGAYLAGRAPPEPRSLSEAARVLLLPKRDFDLGQRLELWGQRRCEVCGTVAMTEADWGQHVASRRHRSALRSRVKLHRKWDGLANALLGDMLEALPMPGGDAAADTEVHGLEKDSLEKAELEQDSSSAVD
ncbi:MAG: hypothetical protein M1829_000515 [Trizodia sp. TS-e1964]|nr:MAG: hypothetical protein M1829_000515 [Trizodia sp. TS-e1964]